MGLLSTLTKSHPIAMYVICTQRIECFLSAILIIILMFIMNIAGSLLRAEFNYMAPKLEDATSSSKQQSSSSTPVGEVASSQVKSLQEDTTRLVDEKVGDFSMGYRWRLMRSLMSGTFCAALNQNTAMSSPFRLFPSRDKSSTSGHQIAQYFSGESVCTENIDAWLKLIPYQPAQQVSGISKSSTGNTSTVFGSSSDRTALKHLIWRDWLLYSPWHSLTFEANASSPRAIHRGNSKSVIKGRRNKRELSMTLTVSAVLLPKLLPVHADLLTALKEKGYSATIDKNVLEKRTELREDKGNKSASLDVIDRIVLRRYVRDSRERDFYVEMIVEDALNKRGNVPKGIDNNAAITGDKSAKGGGSTVVSVMELLPPFYDIKLNTYKYSVHCPSTSTSTSTTRSPTTHFAADLPSFLFTPKAYKDSDCFPQYQDHLADLESNTTSSSSSLSKSRSGLEIENDEKGDRNRNRNRNKSNGKSEQSQECFGSISWTLDLPHGCSIRSVYRAEKRHMHREQHASDASRGLVVPPAIVTLRGE